MRKPLIRRSKLLRPLEFERFEQRLVLAASTASVDEICPYPDDVPAETASLTSSIQVDATRAAEAINRFAFDLYQHFLKESGNVFLSPMSIATALAMTYAGARGDTASQMANVLHFGNEPGIHDSFRAFIDSLVGGERLYDLDLANALWPQVGFPFDQDFLQLIETRYDGNSQSLDYKWETETAKDTINAWVEEKTHDKIKNLIQRLDTTTRMVLTNAIYFKGQWVFKFDPNLTQSLPFQRSPGDAIDVPTMQMQARFRYSELDGFQVLELPYEGRDLSMVLLLPKAGISEAVSPDTLARVNTWLDTDSSNHVVDLKLPKFSMTVDSGLNQVLAEMGMPDAFDEQRANLSGMVSTPIEGNLYIDKVLHKAFVEVNEEGTEAAGATAVVVGITCFAAGTPVLTPNGEVAIEHLRPGDIVLSRSENDPRGKVEGKVIEETFQHRSEIFEVHVGGHVIRTTREHPFYVEGLGWTPTSDLRPKDKLATYNGHWIELEKIVATSNVETVYNLRVSEFHTYFVGRKAWGFAAWVHNDICGAAPTVIGFDADHPFHFLIRDNTNSSIAFMGRVSDPLQTENTLQPKVAETTGPVLWALVENQPRDTNGDGLLTPVDALIIINHLNADDPSTNAARTTDIALMDNSDDGVIAPDDVLILFNWLNRQSSSQLQYAAMYGPQLDDFSDPFDHSELADELLP